MANIYDYLDWRGDLTFEQSPFNEVDNLVLSGVAYVFFDGIVPGIGEGDVTVKEAAEHFFKIHSEAELAADKSFINFAPDILRKMAVSKRFSNAILRNYVSKIDYDANIQFSAIEIRLQDGASYIAFRGTDDSLVGWKEDFMLSFGTVPSEQEAVNYLDQTQKGKKKKLILGGHSKGGHIAIYAAAFCDQKIRNRIIKIYSNDGPGFYEELINTPQIRAVAPLVTKIVPEASVIGMLMEHVATPKIIKSSEVGFMQHKVTAWQVMGTKFVPGKGITIAGKALDQALSHWIHEIDYDKRKIVVDDIFNVLEASGSKGLTNLTDGGIKALMNMLEKNNETDPQTKEIIKLLIKNLASQVITTIPMAKSKTRRKKTVKMREKF